MTLDQVLLSALALTAVIVVPGESEACEPDPCFNSGVIDTLVPVNAAQIPSDGVLVLRADGRGLVDTWSDVLTLDVSLDGQPVAGAFESVPGIGDALLWRPAVALVPGVYTASGTVDNADDLDYCAEDIELDFEFTVDAEPSTTLIAPEVVASEAVVLDLSRELEGLVCCEDVVPVYFPDTCGEINGPSYPQGGCGVFKGEGRLTVSLAIAPKLPVATVGLLAYSLVIDGADVDHVLSPQLEHSSTAPVCTQVRVTNLATGETAITDELCHGEALADKLGPQVIDPTAELTCEGVLQTCEVEPNSTVWDPNNCTPWPGEGETGTPTEGGSDDSDGSDGSEGDADSGSASASGTDTDTDTDTGAGPGEQDGGEKGCGCTSGAAEGSWGLLGLLGLLARRRRGWLRDVTRV